MKSRAIMIAGIIDDVRRVFHGLTEKARKVEHETGLTPTQLVVIKILNDASPMKVSDLAKRMYLHPSTMVGILDRLEIKGLLERTKLGKDRRVVHICLTGSGRELLQNSPETEQGDVFKRLESLTSQQLENAYSGIGQIVGVFGFDEVPPQLIMSSEINTPRRRRKVPS